MLKRQLKIVGTTEVVGFPDVGLNAVKAKVDTGAATSSIHARKIKLKLIDGKSVLSCCLISAKNPELIFENFKVRTVKSSNGSKEDRYVVTLKVQLFNKKYKTEFTLADRKSMTYPVLLGKRLLKNKFLDFSCGS